MAIIGMACLFPGSPGLKAYWQLLMHGRDAVTDIPETHWSAEAYFDDNPKTSDHVYCKRGAFLPPVAGGSGRCTLSERPLDPGHTDEAYARNRRGHFTVSQ